jgi:rhodanese-related sulfurtransferase
MKHEAIYALYPNVVTIDDGAGAFDAQGNQVTIDMAAVNAWVNPNAYKVKRAAEYPSFADQFDLLYHGGMDAWKAAIDAVKTKYPKGE